jgi:hypothetical protein
VLFFDNLIALEDFFDFTDSEFDLCLLITSIIVLRVLGDITIRDGFFEFFSNFSSSDFLEEFYLFLELCKTLLGKENFISHKRNM